MLRCNQRSSSTADIQRAPQTDVASDAIREREIEDPVL